MITHFPVRWICEHGFGYEVGQSKCVWYIYNVNSKGFTGVHPHYSIPHAFASEQDAIKALETWCKANPYKWEQCIDPLLWHIYWSLKDSNVTHHE